MTEPTIRPFRAEDTDACYAICLRTGDNGRDATHLFSDPRLLGEIYVGPYLARWPEYAFVVEDEPGVAGYIVGSPDTAEHERWLETAWWPALRERYPRGSFGDEPAAASCVAHIHAPPLTDAEIVARYPAHLHVDLLERSQGRGYGRRLMDRLLEALDVAGVQAIHLACSPDNVAAIAFYERVGFAEIRDRTWFGRSTATLG